MNLFPRILIIFFTLVSLTSFGPLFGSTYLTELKEGNERFIKNNPIHEKLTKEERKKMAEGQAPFATIVACSDSRVAPEIIFDQGGGSLFVVRLAGNTVDSLALGSVEYGLTVLGTPLLVVMGHENCGAVQAAFDLGKKDFSIDITEILEKIEPSVKKALKRGQGKTHDDIVNIAIEENVRHTMNEILNSLPEAKKRVSEGKLQTENTIFHINTGKVEWLGH